MTTMTELEVGMSEEQHFALWEAQMSGQVMRQGASAVTRLIAALLVVAIVSSSLTPFMTAGDGSGGGDSPPQPPAPPSGDEYDDEQFVDGQDFNAVISTSSGEAEVLAEVSISGRQLTLGDVAVYGRSGDMVGQFGVSHFVRLLRAVQERAASQGFATSRIHGVRVQIAHHYCLAEKMILYSTLPNQVFRLFDRRRCILLEEYIQKCKILALEGKTSDEIMKWMRGKGLTSQLDHVRVMREVYQISLGKAKRLVDSSPTWGDRQSTNESVRVAAERAVEAMEGGET